MTAATPPWAQRVEPPPGSLVRTATDRYLGMIVQLLNQLRQLQEPLRQPDEVAVSHSFCLSF